MQRRATHRRPWHARGPAPLLAVSAWWVVAPATSLGQEGISGQNPRVQTTAQVEVQVDSGPGVDSERLLDWSEVVGRRTDELRGCYAERLEDAPTLEGQMRIALVVTRQRPRPDLEVKADDTEDSTLGRCIRRELRRVRIEGITHPETVFVELTFKHSIAEAVRELEERAARARAAFEAGLEITRTEGGGFRAAGEAGNRMIYYRGEAPTEAGAKRLAALAHGRLPALFDCRRRASRRGASPAGEVTLGATIDDRGRVRARVQENTVATRGADRCVRDAFASRPDEGAAVEGQLLVGFRDQPE